MSNDELAPPGRKRATILLVVGGYANTVISIVQGVLLVPLYLHFIGATNYGYWLASGGMLGMMLMMNFGLGTLLTQRVANAYGQKDSAGAAAYFINGMFLYTCICLVYGAIGWLISLWLPEILSLNDDNAELFRDCFQVAVLATTMSIFNECLRSFGTAMLRPVFPMLALASGRILGIVVTVWMLFEELGLWAIPIGLLINEGLVLIVNLLFVISLFKKIATRARLEMGLIKEYITSSPALLMAKTGNAVSQESEPLLITMSINAETTTAYMIARKAADLVFMIASVLNGSILGSVSHLAGEADAKKMKNTAASLLFASFAVSLIGFSAYIAANNTFVSLWVGENYVFDQYLIIVIGVGFCARSVRGMAWQILYSIGDFTWTSRVVLGEGLAKISLALALLGPLGVAAVPYALMLTGFMSFLALILRLKKLLSFESGNVVVRLLASVLVCGTIAWLFSSHLSWIAFVGNSLLLMIALTLAVFLINRSVCMTFIEKFTHGAKG
jgi:O-antigen/teichoic acid export membrane protein